MATIIDQHIRDHIGHCMIDRLTESALNLKRNLESMRHTYAYSYRRYHHDQCWICGASPTSTYYIPVDDMMYKEQLCDRCISYCQKIESALLPTDIISRRIKTLSHQFTTFCITGNPCIICCENKGIYINASNYSICRKCKVTGIKMHHAEVLFILSHVIDDRDVRCVILMLIWNMSFGVRWLG